MLSPLYGQLSPLCVPTAGGPVRVLSADADANTYLLAVEAADGQELEEDVISAVEDFVTGCKTDGIWSAIKASCILAGARTLNGALVPLVGSAPTNNNFVTGDYDRETGLKGNGTTKYLNSNRFADSDGQNDMHVSAYRSQYVSQSQVKVLIGYYKPASPAVLTHIGNTGSTFQPRANNLTLTSISGQGSSLGFYGVSRSSSSSFVYKTPSSSIGTVNISSISPGNLKHFVFAMNDNGNFSSSYANASRLSFYSIGESIDLAALDTRVSTLMTDLAAAI
jgi:hypothetical protein